MKCLRDKCDLRAVVDSAFCHKHMAAQPLPRASHPDHDVEIVELSSFSKADVASVKSFVRRELTGAPPLLEELGIVFVVALVAIAGIGVWHDTPPASPELEHCRADLARLEQLAGQYATVITAGLNGWPITDGERFFYITEARRR